MDGAGRCETCGGPLGQEEGPGLSCPRCLLLLAMPGETMGRNDAGSRLQPGTTIGRYRIVRLIGDGGMGAVYQAEQESPRRTVALKLIKPEFSSLEILRRFEQESRALGRLQHPGIAQIFEAGAADTGHGPQPYFAMEFIRGQSLREYAVQHHLSPRDRLALVARVCDAVHHAHHRGLIHRDLKPDNILVDEAGQPKVLDFGVARVTDGDMQTTLFTGIGQLVGTLAYMSPEQALDDPLELDTRSDVYALGVILYELLANRMPYSIGKTVLEAAQAIREADPARLSSFDRSYRGDIETIAARALEKDKTRRYSSAAELAADIRRYLSDEPIVARPPSARYQLQKFARRNKPWVIGIVAVVVVLAGGVATTTWFAVGLNRERGRNESKAAFEALARRSLNYDDGEGRILFAVQSLRVHSRIPDEARYPAENALQSAATLSPVGRVIYTHRMPVTSLAFSQTHLVSGSVDGTVRVLDLSKPTDPPRIFKLDQTAPYPVNAVAISPDGTLLIAAGSVGFKIWDLRENKEEPLATRYEKGIITSVAFSPKESRLAIGSRKGVSIWTVEEALKKGPASASLILDSGSDIASLAFSRDGSLLATTGEGLGIRIRDAHNRGTLLTTLDPGASFMSVTFSPDDIHVAARHFSGEVKVWNWRLQNSPGRSLGQTAHRSSQPEANWAHSLAFSPVNGSLLASTDADGMIRVWNLAQPGDMPWRYWRGHGATVVAFSPKGELTSGGSDNRVRIWRFWEPVGPPYRLPPGERVQSLGFSDNTILTELPGDRSGARSDDGNLVAFPKADGSIEVLDRRRSTRRELSPAGNTGIVANALAFSRRGDLLAAAIGTEVVVWKIENPDAAPFRTFQGASRFLAFTSEDTRLVGVRVDAAEARMWDLRDPISPPISFKSGSSANIRSIAVPRDGDDYLALGDEEGNTWVWPLWEAAANRLCARVTRNLSMKEWQSVMPQSIPYKATCPALPAGTDAR